MSIRIILSVFLFSSCISISATYAQNNDDLLVKVGTSNVTVGEFKYIYEKNNGSSANYSKSSLDEYLDLYAKFKLKVEKAKKMKLDTIEALKVELDGYRKQLASSYLIDKEVTDYLLKELYERTKTDVEFGHIFVPVPENASSADRQAAKSKINDIKAKFESGLSFENAARSFSEDRVSGPLGGYMGFLTAKLPSGFYDIETALYKLDVGKVSDVIPSKIGYHIIKVISRRPARGQVEVAHILIDIHEEDTAKKVYNLLQAGSNFEELASMYSQDKTTANNGGRLATFGINTYDVKFENVAFELIKPGDYSEPLQTGSGWHIIKLINKPAFDSYEVFVKKMKSQINKDPRFELAKLKLVSDIKKASGFKNDKNELNRFVAGLTEEVYSYKWNPDSDMFKGRFLCSFGGSTIYYIQDFVEFCKKNTRTRLKYDKTKPINETIDELYTDFLNEKAMEYEEQSLPIKHPDFKSLMREYEEGILLFEVTKMNVWDRANQDTLGLIKYFDTHRAKYKSPEKARILGYKINSADKNLAQKIYAFAKSNTESNTIKKFNSKHNIVEYISEEYEKGSDNIPVKLWSKGATSELLPEGNASFVFHKISDLLPSQNRTLSEARGYVVADYQDFLEKDWIAQLTKEFPIVWNKPVLEKLKK